MTARIEASFEVKSWDEQPFDEAAGVAKLTKASVAKEYSGDVEGSSVTEWVMAYQPDESAVFLGVERIKGAVGGRRGSLVLQHIGTFAEGVAKADLTVLSGTDELSGADGGGTFVADPAGRISLTIDL